MPGFYGRHHHSDRDTDDDRPGVTILGGLLAILLPLLALVLSTVLQHTQRSLSVSMNTAQLAHHLCPISYLILFETDVAAHHEHTPLHVRAISVSFSLAAMAWEVALSCSCATCGDSCLYRPNSFWFP